MTLETDDARLRAAGRGADGLVLSDDRGLEGFFDAIVGLNGVSHTAADGAASRAAILTRCAAPGQPALPNTPERETRRPISLPSRSSSNQCQPRRRPFGAVSEARARRRPKKVLGT